MRVYAYAREHYDHWREREGIHPSSALLGERWSIGSALLEVAQPRAPCYKLGIRLGDEDFPRKFIEVGRPGAYLRVVRAGDVGAGDAVEVTFRPEHGVTPRAIWDARIGPRRRTRQ